jgi:aryl-alcohol dehydrogenase-like predicted oxidoreductase
MPGGQARVKMDPAAPALAVLGSNRKVMVRSVEESLKRLKTDRIDLYFVHMDDGVTPVDEIARGLDDLVRAGKIVYGGLSNFPAWRVATAANTADLRGWAPIAALQTEYSLLQRTTERELLPMANGWDQIDFPEQTVAWPATSRRYKYPTPSGQGANRGHEDAATLRMGRE